MRCEICWMFFLFFVFCFSLSWGRVKTDRQEYGRMDGLASSVLFCLPFCLRGVAHGVCTSIRRSVLRLQWSLYSAAIRDKPGKHSSALMIMGLFGVGGNKHDTTISSSLSPHPVSLMSCLLMPSLTHFFLLPSLFCTLSINPLGWEGRK